MIEEIHKYIYRYRNPKFKEEAKHLIDLIYKVPITPMKDQHQAISHTDWEITKNMKREYLDYFVKNNSPDFGKSFCEFTHYSKLILRNIWFQVYEKGDFHTVHTHPNCNFSNVFYLQLENTQETIFMDGSNNEKIKVSIETGDILTFPSFMTHGSPLNKNNKSKIVLAFNTDVYIV